MRKVSIKYYVLSIMGVGVAFFAFHILHSTFYIPVSPTFAAGTECQQQVANARAQGLISIGSNQGVIGTFGNPSGTCAFDPKAAFISYKLPTYEELESIYYTQSKSPAKKATPLNTFPVSFSGDGIYLAPGDLNLVNFSGSGTGTQIIFVRGNLSIVADYIYPQTGGSLYGTVFIVKGDVLIDKDINIVTAVIISGGTICTGYDSVNLCTLNNVVNAAQSPLNIFGSLISLTNIPIRFQRSLGPLDAGNPAETIQHQSKYVVILRDLFSGTLQKWSEVAGVPYLPTPGPTSIPTPIPTAGPPTPTPTPTPLYKRVFVTSTSNNGNLGGLSGADSICQTLANNATPTPLGGTWMAWLSITGSDPSTRFITKNNGPYVRIDGVTVANNWDDLTNGDLAVPINLTENNVIGNSWVWTNTNSSGTVFGSSSCSNWTNTPGSTQTGRSIRIDPTWTSSGLQACSATTNSFYCFEQ